MNRQQQAVYDALRNGRRLTFLEAATDPAIGCAVNLPPVRCRDLTPWMKECDSCGHMKRLEEFRLLTARTHRGRGGTVRECAECEAERWRTACGLKRRKEVA